MAFREWHGIQFLTDLPTVPERPLSANEMVAWFQLATDFPAVARDVLKLQEKAAAGNSRLQMRDVRWAPERRQMLIELHQYAIQMAVNELRRVERMLKDASKSGQASDSMRGYRRGKVMATERVLQQLSEQLQSLQKLRKNVSRSTP